MCNKTQYHYVFNAIMLYNKALIFLLVRQHFSARSIFSLRSRSQVLINIPPQFDEGQEKVILSCCLSSHVVTCYDAKSGGLASKLIEDSYRAFDANEHFPPNVSVAWRLLLRSYQIRNMFVLGHETSLGYFISKDIYT